MEISILNKLNLEWFYNGIEFQNLFLKESYRFNVASLPKRFNETDPAFKIAYNMHRYIDVSKEFSDDSEKDVAYTSGGRDVISGNYGWGCAITSQEISYAYAKIDSQSNLVERSLEDMALTILVMYQRYTCIMLNEKIHSRFDGTSSIDIHDLKGESLEFIAYGTLAPSQISRWNNVCETYRYLQELTGLNESMSEIREKIDLLNEEQDRLDEKRDAAISTLFTVFGIVSIIASLLQIVDYVLNGSTVMLVSFVISLLFSVVFLTALLLRIKRRKPKKHF